MLKGGEITHLEACPSYKLSTWTWFPQLTLKTPMWQTVLAKLELENQSQADPLAHYPVILAQMVRFRPVQEISYSILIGFDIMSIYFSILSILVTQNVVLSNAVIGLITWFCNSYFHTSACLYVIAHNISCIFGTQYIIIAEYLCFILWHHNRKYLDSINKDITTEFHSKLFCPEVIWNIWPRDDYIKLQWLTWK